MKKSLRLVLMFSVVNEIINLAGNITRAQESKTSCYARLQDDIKNRLTVVHKIPPNIEDDFKKPFPISFEFMLVAVSEMDELQQVITVDAYLEIRWTQTELAWNSSFFCGLEWAHLNAYNIWSPSIVIAMGHSPTFLLPQPPDVLVYSNGTVVSNTLSFLSFSCNVNFDRYPFDEQICKVAFIIIGDAPLPKVEIINTSKTQVIDFVNLTGEWSVINFTYEIIHTKMEEADMPQYTFIIKRNSMYYVITAIFPMVLTSVMIPLVFLIPVKTGEKMSYLTAIFTSSAVYLNYISAVMPRTLTSMPYLAILLIEVLSEGLFATLASLIVVNIYQREETISANRIHPKGTPTSKDGSCYQMRTEGQQELLSARTKSCPEIVLAPMITSRALDVIFFTFFSVSQTVILVIMFGFVGWVEI